MHAVSFAWALGGCSVLTDLGGLSADAGVDAPSEAAFDGGVDADLFFDDFDETPLGARWNGMRTEAGVPRLDDAAVSAPYAALFAVSNPSKTTPLDSNLLLDLPPTTNGLLLDFDMRVEGQDTTTDLWFVDVNVNAAAPFNAYQIEFRYKDTQHYLLQTYVPYVDGGSAPITYYTFSADFSSFHHVTLDMDWSSKPSVTLSIDQVSTALGPLPTTKSMGATLAMGASAISNTTNAWRIHIDNVRVRAK